MFTIIRDFPTTNPTFARGFATEEAARQCLQDCCGRLVKRPGVDGGWARATHSKTELYLIVKDVA